LKPKLSQLHPPSPNLHFRIWLSVEMSADMSAEQRLPLDKEKLKKKFDVSHFDFNAVIRGVQLTLVGGTQPSSPPPSLS
jgi:hypothetical protein